MTVCVVARLIFHSCPRFRRQHEQLRQVIIRVLRPSTKGRTGTPGAEEQDLKTEPVVDEAADANAIEVGLIVFVYTEHWHQQCINKTAL